MLHLSRRQEPPDAAPRKRASPKPKRLPRTGTCNSAANSAPAKSRQKKTFREASEQFLREYDIITQGQRSKDYVKGQHWRSRMHLVPFFGHMGLSEITAGKVQEYRIHRHEEAMAKRGKPPAHNTMHQEIVTLRQTLKTAIRHGWLDHLPDLSEPYRASPKISHRAWFSPEEYKKLYEATRKRAQEPKKARYKWESRTTSRLRAVHGQHRPAAR